MFESLFKYLFLLTITASGLAHAAEIKVPYNVRCEALLLDRIREIESGTIKVHPGLLVQWRENPSRAIVVKARFQKSKGWIGDAVAILKGTKAGLVPGEPDARILSLDGWMLARMIRALDEVRFAGELGFDWLNRQQAWVSHPETFQEGAPLLRFRRLVAQKQDNELIVVTVQLKHSAHDAFGVFRETVALYGGLVASPGLYSDAALERLEIALPNEQSHAQRLLLHLARVPELRGWLFLRLSTAKQFSAFAHEDATWVLDAHQQVSEAPLLKSEDEAMSDSEKRFSLLDLDERHYKKNPESFLEEKDSAWIRFSLIELDDKPLSNEPIEDETISIWARLIEID